MGWDGWIWIGSTGREQRQLRRGEGRGREGKGREGRFRDLEGREGRGRVACCCLLTGSHSSDPVHGIAWLPHAFSACEPACLLPHQRCSSLSSRSQSQSSDGSWIGEVLHPSSFGLDQRKVTYGRTPTGSRSSGPDRIMHLIHHLVLMALLLASSRYM
jgi:hypothetical protein